MEAEKKIVQLYRGRKQNSIELENSVLVPVNKLEWSMKVVSEYLLPGLVSGWGWMKCSLVSQKEKGQRTEYIVGQ